MKNLNAIVLFLFSIQVCAQSAEQSVFVKNQKFDSEGVELYESNLQLKTYKKFGLGAGFGGLNGLFGLNFEANVAPENAIFIGWGGGSSYNTVSAGWKHNVESEYLSLYTKVGLSKWFNSGSASAKADQSDILRKALSQNEISQNRFNVNFLAGGAGLEYNQLEGELSGLNLFAELLLLTDISRIDILPTGSLGITYFY